MRCCWIAATDRASKCRWMIRVCACRHRENVISLDRGTLRYEPVDAARGTNGPVRWYVAAAEVPRQWRRGHRAGWILLAEETAVNVVQPATDVAAGSNASTRPST